MSLISSFASRSDRQHKDREKDYDEKSTRSGSRGQDWRDWKQTGTTVFEMCTITILFDFSFFLDSPDQWLDDRHRRSRDRSRSPLHIQAPPTKTR